MSLCRIVPLEIWWFALFVSFSVASSASPVDMSAEDLFRANRWTEAEKAFSAYVSRHPRPPDAGAALLRIADCQTARGDRKKARKAIDRIHGYVVSETRLDIHLPKVIDPQESVVRDIDKLSVGSVTFVNLDNDDADALFDDADGEVLRVDAATGDRTGDNELVKLRLNLSSDTPSNATVRLTVPKGAGYVAVWTNNTKTASARYTPGSDIPLSDFRRDGDCLVKDLWAEGVAPHAEPRGTEFLMECTLDDGCVVSSRVALTVLGVQSVIWKGRGNSRYDTNELDGDPNWPSGGSATTVVYFWATRLRMNLATNSEHETLIFKLVNSPWMSWEPAQTTKIHASSLRPWS